MNEEARQDATKEFYGPVGRSGWRLYSLRKRRRHHDYEEGAFSTIFLHWDEAKQTLTIGERQGEFPAMMRHRTFQVVWVGEGHGVGVNVTEPIDKLVQYDGQPVTVNR